MITYLDETYRMRVDIMRHQIKAVENQREIDLERVTNNKNKSNSGNKNTGSNSNASKPLLRSYCPMCDVRFYGPLTGHRKSDRHRVNNFILFYKFVFIKYVLLKILIVCT